MADHRDGPRLVNQLFPIFQQLSPRQQVIMTQLMGASAPGNTFGFQDAAELEAEVEEARRHFQAKLDATT
jgi:hypothetical protein